LLTELPESIFQVIFLRNNILTYCRQEDQISTLTSILNCLAAGGLLIIGRHEILPFESTELVAQAECAGVYQKK